MSVTTDANIIGDYPQGHCFESDEANVCVEIDVKCKFTDILVITNIYEQEEIVLSQKAYMLLKSLLPNFAFVRNVKLNGKVSAEPYYSIRFGNGVENLIDFKNCKMSLYNYKGEVGSLEINDFEDFIEKWISLMDGSYDGYLDQTIDLACTNVAFSGLPSESVFQLVSGKIVFYKKEGLVVDENFREIVLSNVLTGFEFEKLNYKVVETDQV